MSETDYARASVLLFDPVHVNQRTTRYALFEIGFRQIECVSNLKDFKDAIEESTPALIVAEASATDIDVFKVVRSIRRSELGTNPFVVILLTSWSRDTLHVKKAIESGADDVIVRPFSTSFAEERVRTLVKARKDFVVTSDYIGPDRRKSKDRDSTAQALPVPNVLKAYAEADHEALTAASKEIKSARDNVRSERLRRLAMRIVIAVELKSRGSSETGKAVKIDLDDLKRTARELRAELIAAERMEAAEVAEALVEQVESIDGPAAMTEAALRLTKELAMGAYAAYANGESIERSKDEIGKTVDNLRKRLKKRAETAAQRRAEEEARKGEDGEAAA